MSSRRYLYSNISGLASHFTPKHTTSKQTTTTHNCRTAESEARFLLPYIKKTDKILDIGCGTGTITVGFTKFATEGSVTGVDICDDALKSARELAAESKPPDNDSGSRFVAFQEADIFQGLPFPDNTFDIVYSCQVFASMPIPDYPLRALAEARRVLKPGGILATRDVASEHIYPAALDLDRLLVHRLALAMYGGETPIGLAGPNMASLVCRAGFEDQAGKVKVIPGVSAITTPGDIVNLANCVVNQLAEGATVRQNWLNAGISSGEIERTLSAVRKLTMTEGAWCMVMQCQILAWK